MPPKMKKPPKNAYYFYMKMRKDQLEAQGYRFPGGMKDVANAVGGEWAQMDKEAKMPFEEEARLSKQEGKSDLSNKYTVTGESYAQVQKRVMEERELAEEQENYIAELAMGEGALDRMFVFIKTIHCVEQIIERNKRVYWPLEIGLCAFSLREGLRSINWTLVDTMRTPVGYASAAKETSEETGLPEPGSKMMEEYRDYNKIMKNVKGFIEFWTKKNYRKGPVVFAMEQEVDHARGCLQWLVSQIEDDVHDEYQLFVDTLKMYKLPKLILRLAEYAHQLNPEYDNVMTQYRLENSAASIVNKGCYDYRDEITCNFHKREQASLKMHTCCRNIVLKRMFLLFEEFLPAFGLQKMDRHDIDQLGKAAAAKSKTNIARAAASASASATARRDSQQEDRYPVSSATSAGGGWSKAPKVEQPRSSSYSSDRRDRDDVSDNSFGGSGRQKRKHEDESERDSFRTTSTRSHHEGPPAKSLMRSHDEDWEKIDSPPSPSLSAEEPPSPSLTSAEPAAFVPWGRKQEAPAASFLADDFPALGTAPPARHGGMGRGRGRSVSNDNDDMDQIGSAGRGGKPTAYY